jgi:hypothetical protein
MRSLPRMPLAASLVVLLAGAVLSGCGSEEIALPAPMESEARPRAGDATDADGEYCRAVAEMEEQATDLHDPAQALEALSALRAAAPAGLRDSFDVLRRVAARMAELDPASPEYIDESFGILLDPDLQAAAVEVEAYTVQACGIDLGGDATDPFDDDPFEMPLDDPELPDLGMPDTGGERDIDLEHISAVKDRATGTWLDKLVMTTILDDTEVVLSADASNPVTVDEAMAACTALHEELVSINPLVTIEIRNDETTVVRARAGGACAPV